MQFVLKHRVQCLQWYITLVVSFASYPCNEQKTDVGRPKCESETSITHALRHIHVYDHYIQTSPRKRHFLGPYIYMRRAFTVPLVLWFLKWSSVDFCLIFRGKIWPPVLLYIGTG